MAKSHGDGILRYPGGKYFARKMLVSLFPPAIKEYREPLLGGGSVYLSARRSQVAETYWINDLHDPLMSFWKAAQDPTDNQQMREALYRWMEKRTSPQVAKRIFKYMRRQSPSSTCAKAIRFFLLNRFSFSGTTESGGVSRTAPFDRFTSSAIDRLQTLVELLKDVRISCCGYEELFDVAPDDFLFLDPPYGSSSKLYGVNGDRHQFDLVLFADRLRNVRGRFLLTLNDDGNVRDLFSWANVQPFEMRYGMNNCGKLSKSTRRGSELLIANYDLPPSV